MEPSTDGEPVLPTTEIDDAAAPKITDTQWRAIKSVLDALLAYRDEEYVMNILKNLWLWC